MAEQNPTLADLSPSLQTLRQAVIAFVDRGAIATDDIAPLCEHLATLDRKGGRPSIDSLRHVWEYFPGSLRFAADGIKGTIMDAKAGLERGEFSAEQILKAIGDGAMAALEGAPRRDRSGS